MTPINFVGWKKSLQRSSIVSAIASVVRIRAHLGVYVRGQLSDLLEKSVEPIARSGCCTADVARVPQPAQVGRRPGYEWLQQDVAAEHGGPHTIGIIDETSDVKKGDKTPGSEAVVWPPARPKTASSPSISVSLAATFTAFSTVSCTCRKVGTPTATGAVKLVFPILWSTGPSGRSAWSCTSER